MVLYSKPLNANLFLSASPCLSVTNLLYSHIDIFIHHLCVWSLRDSKTVCVCVSVCVRACISTLRDWLLSSWIYGFIRGAWYSTTYHLRVHHNNDIVATGMCLQITGVLKWVAKSTGSVFFCASKKDPKRFRRFCRYGGLSLCNWR